MIEIIAIFAACQMNLLICKNMTHHRTFEDMDTCKKYIERIVPKANRLRKKSNHPFPIVMAKCKYQLIKSN